MRSAKYKIINKRKRRLIQAADVVLNLMASLGLLSREKHPKSLTELTPHIHRILIVRLAYIGDIVMTQPVIAPLRKAFPHATIDFLTSTAAAPLLETDPAIDNVLTYDAPWFYGASPRNSNSKLSSLIKNNYDLGIDFRADLRNIWHCLYRPGVPYRVSYTSGGGGALLTHPVTWSQWKHKVEFHLDILRKAGLEAPAADPIIHIKPDESHWIRSLLQQINCQNRSPIVIHPGSRLSLKCWPVDRFVELIQRINTHNLGPVILVEAPGNEARTAAIASRVSVAADLAGKLTIRQMAALFQHCRTLVCHDSAPMHIAAAVGCRTVAMFGPSRSMETAPSGTGHQIVEMDCVHKTDCDEQICLSGKPGGCMADLDVDVVYSALIKSLASEVDKL